jgi:hypothetical protein
MTSWTLGPELRMPLPFSPGAYMRIYEDIRKCVVFFGFEDSSKPGGIACIGTGFLMMRDGVGYLVTARHLSHQLKGDPDQRKSDPFLVRLNKKDGTAASIPFDEVEWHEHTDPHVDVAIVPLHITREKDYDVSYMTEEFLIGQAELEKERIGVANLTYTLGLFRLMTGAKRNLAICHVGSIALMPEDEKVPVRDWTDTEEDPNKRRRIFVDAYLVESQSIGGLSGSPVLVRLEEIVDMSGVFGRYDGTKLPAVALHSQRVRLLGLWQGAWEAPPDEVKAAEAGTVLVPLGMGLVVPCSKIVELLDRDDVKKQREILKNQMLPNAATTQSVQVERRPQKAGNPDHREDFNRLLGAAVKRPKSSDQT